MGNKRIRKNSLKKNIQAKHSRVLQRCILSLKIISVAAIVALTCLFFVFCYSFITQCDYFRLEKTTITGIKILYFEQVMAQAGIRKNSNILSLNLPLVRKKLEAHPWIAEAEVRRALPDKIIIRITEHTPLAALNLGHKFIMNNKGKIFKKMTSEDHFNFPIINGLKLSDFSLINNQKSIQFYSIMDVLQLGRRPESILSYRFMKRIEIDRELGLTIFASMDGSDRQKKIILGYDNYLEKFKKVEEIIYCLKKNSMFSDFNTIDLVNLDRVVVTPVTIKPTTLKIKKEI
ncbi:MAG TPA: hypothetical protein DD405_04995 [Desulfobacteraceae bacterium]|nr:hypothetical protein [Desulfobacteraceae bacterium]